MNDSYLKISVIIIILSLLFSFFVACSHDDVILTGTVTEVNGKSVTLLITEGETLVSDQTVLTITERTRFNGGVSKIFQVGDLISFTIKGEVLESYPTRTTAKRIISINTK